MSTPTGLVLAPWCQPLPPRRLGSFQITAQIASGRRAEIYLGHREGEPKTALRLRTPKPGHDARAFTREAQRVIAFGGPGSAAGVEEVDRIAVAWGPPVVGESLAVLLDALMAEKVPLPVELAITIAMGIAERLGKGARHVHGDLAPHHVIVGYDGSIALIDPSGAEDAAERADAPSRSGYRSPEHVKGQPVTSASDVFVLGALLFELTTATRLFAAPTPRETDAAIIAGGYPRPRAVLGDHYPIELQVLLRKLLRAQPEGRFPDGEAALEGLRLAASVRTEGQEDRVGEWMRAHFRERYAAWSTVLSGFGVDMSEEPLDFDADPTENPDVFDLPLAQPNGEPPGGARPSGVPWPVWSPPPAPPPAAPPALRSPAPGSPVPGSAVRRSSTLPNPRPPIDEPIDLDEQTRPVGSGGALAPDRLLTALDLRTRPRSVADPTDPAGQLMETSTEESVARPAPDARSLAASRERTVVSAPPGDPDEQTWVEPSPVPAKMRASSAIDDEVTRGDGGGVAWDLELPDDIDPDETQDDGDIPSLLDDADLQMLSGSEAATPLPRGAIPADLASDLLGEDFRDDDVAPATVRANGRLDDRAVPEPRKVRQRADSTLLDPSAAPTQVGAAATPMPARSEPLAARRGPAPTAILEGLTAPPVRPAPAPPRREETVIVRQRVIPRDNVQPEISPEDAGGMEPDETSPLVAAVTGEVSDADIDGLLVIPVADEEGARKKSRLVQWLVLGAAVLLGLTLAAWWAVGGMMAPPPGGQPPIPRVVAVPPPPSPSLPATATAAATATTAPQMLDPLPEEVAPEEVAPEEPPSPSPTTVSPPPRATPAPRATPPAPTPSPTAAVEPDPEPDPEASPEATPEPEVSDEPAPRATPRRRTPPPPPPPPPTPKGPMDIKVTAFPASATLRVGGRELPSGSRITVGDEPVIVTVTAEGYQEQMVELRVGPRKEVSVVLRRKK